MPTRQVAADDPHSAARLSIGELWSTFKATGSGPAREQLIVHYSPLVKYVASRVATGLPSSASWLIPAETFRLGYCCISFFCSGDRFATAVSRAARAFSRVSSGSFASSFSNVASMNCCCFFSSSF